MAKMRGGLGEHLVTTTYDPKGNLNGVVFIGVAEIESGEVQVITGVLRRNDKKAYRIAEQIVSLPLLLSAAEVVIANWENGDLASAVRLLDAAVQKSKGE